MTQVFEDEDAKQNAALYDGNYETPVWPLLAQVSAQTSALHGDGVRYGKVREWTDLHDRVQWIGFVKRQDWREAVVSASQPSNAQEMALNGYDALQIADKLGRPLTLVREWLELDVLSNFRAGNTRLIYPAISQDGGDVFSASLDKTGVGTGCPSSVSCPLSCFFPQDTKHLILLCAFLLM